MTSLRLITLDATGTIFKFVEPPPLVYSRLASHHGIQREPELVAKSFWKSFKTVDKKWPHFGAVSGVSHKIWWDKVIEGTFEGEDLAKVSKLSDELFDFYSSKEAYHVFPDFIQFVNKWAETENLALAVLSNYDKRLPEVLQKLNLSQYFETIVTSNEAQISKPSPEFFQYALKQIKCKEIKAHQILHIGDDQEKDYKGAKNVGWHALLINRSNNGEKHAEDTCDSFKRVTEHLLARF